jgi:glycosyltransferase involved in cell wall biosynthesis
VIPAKDESRYISHVISRVLDQGYSNIIVVNDGSADNTAELADSYATVTVLNHWVNLGPGASTYTGIKYALIAGADIIVTLDADNQHDPKDIDRLVSTLAEEELDFVLGSRFMKKNKIPTSRIIYNKIGNYISYFITGLYLSDSQSGVKAMSNKFCTKLDLKHNGFEFCIEIIKQAKLNDAAFKEIPVNVRYSKETMRKGQNLVTGFNMVARLLKPF